ncbi:hypothetical protein [Halalkalibacter okhensis]|nr:hypothetical protein [Halalkalibacter okhensis]
MFYEEENLGVGLFWGILLSVPLWLSLWGWIKLVSNLSFFS